MLSDETRARWKQRWPHIRGALILFHVVAVIVLGFPAPAGVMDRQQWREPSVQNEMRLWTDRVNTVGFTFTQEEFEDLLWDLSKSFLAVRNTVIKPFKPYAEYLGLRQDWRMFSAPHRWPVRLHIDVMIDGRWQEVYVSRSEDADWRRDTFDHHRIRRIVFLHAWAKYKRRYKTFCDWVARMAAEDFPTATRVRIRQFKYRTPEPAERRAGDRFPEGKFQATRELKLADFRKEGRAP